MTTDRRLLTLAEYEALPDDGLRHQLIDGVVVTMPGNGFRRGEIAATIAYHLGNFVAPRRLARVATNDPNIVVRRGPDTVLAPDVAVVLSARVPHEGMPSRPTTIVPDLVVDVCSPSDTVSMVGEKTRRWLDAGVQLVWNVDLETETVEVCRRDAAPLLLDANATLDAEPVLPGFSVPVSELFI
jgi:Uma2 family endonuclease